MRVYGILADYADQNDYDVLRSDPLFKLLGNRSIAAADLSSAFQSSGLGLDKEACVLSVDDDHKEPRDFPSKTALLRVLLRALSKTVRSNVLRKVFFFV